MRQLTDPSELHQLRADRPNQTHTYQVTEDVFASLTDDTAGDLRTMDDNEVAELADYLGIDSSELTGDFRVVDTSCPDCSRQVTVLDFAKTAVAENQHDRSSLADVLAGRAGQWITVRGRDGGRPVRCANCGSDIAPLRNNYSEYSGGGYAYA